MDLPSDATPDTISEEDFERVLDEQDGLIAAGYAELAQVLGEVYESGEPCSVPASILGRQRNKTTGHRPEDFPALATMLDLAWYQHGVPAGQGPSSLRAVILPGELAFTETCHAPVRDLLVPSASSEWGKIQTGEAAVVARFEDILAHPAGGRAVLEQLGVDAVAGSVRTLHPSQASRPIAVTEHGIAGMTSLPRMYAEIDLVVAWEDAPTGALQAAVVEAKCSDAERFTTAQLGRSRAALAAMAEEHAMPLAGGMLDIRTWQLHGTDTDALKLYHFSFGHDICLDRTLVEVLAIRED